MGTACRMLTLLLIIVGTHARPYYDDPDMRNAKFLEALLYEKTETLKAAISLLSQLNLPLLCQSVASDPHAQFATVADLLHFATVVVQAQENITSGVEDPPGFTTLSTTVPFDKITSVYPKAETATRNVEGPVRSVYPRPDGLALPDGVGLPDGVEDDIKEVDELHVKDRVNGKLLSKETVVINSVDSIGGENGLESASRMMTNKTRQPIRVRGEAGGPDTNDNLLGQKPTARINTRHSTARRWTPITETPEYLKFPQTTEGPVTLEGGNRIPDLDRTIKQKRPDESFYGRSDQEPSRPTFGQSRAGFTTPLHWLIRDKWPEIERSTHELINGRPVVSADLSREVGSNTTGTNETKTLGLQDHDASTQSAQNVSSVSDRFDGNKTTAQSDKPSAKSTTDLGTSPSTAKAKSSTTNSQKTTTDRQQFATTTKKPKSGRRTPTHRKSPYSSKAPVVKTVRLSTQAPVKTDNRLRTSKSPSKPSRRVTNRTNNPTEPLSKSTSTSRNISSISQKELISTKSVKPEPTTQSVSTSKVTKLATVDLNVTRILELTKTATPATRRSKHSRQTTSKPVVSSKTTPKLTSRSTETVTTNATNDTEKQNATSDNSNITNVEDSRSDNVTVEMKTTVSAITDNSTSRRSNSSFTTAEHTPSTELNTSQVNNSTDTKSTTASVTTGMSTTTTTTKVTPGPLPIINTGDLFEKKADKGKSGQRPTLREKIVPVHNSKDTGRTDVEDYHNEITVDEKEDESNLISPGQNGDDSFGFFTCPTIFGFYPDAINCGQFYICSWSIPYHFDCPVGTVWNTELTVCDWPFNVNCGTRPWYGRPAFEKHFLPSQL